MHYSLLAPLSVQVNMGESRVTLRNYPLPLLHMPATKKDQSTRLPSWSLRSDVIIAEEYHGPESTRPVRIEVIPESNKDTHGISQCFVVEISRTVSPVKTYSEINIGINTSSPTGITWGTSYQPAIQDMMQVIEKFTKQRIDPSRSIGFWDKIRLVVHSRLRVAWDGGGDVHLRLKGASITYSFRHQHC